ncbi:MAG: ABC transporter permease, partial [Solirubrobacterales bacterium]|nr:ABC transporter permease [Solirubrobacterales bacterium]
GLVAVYILPSPDQVVTELYRDWGSVLRSATLVTLEEMFIGFLIAVAVGLGIAVLLQFSAIVRRALYPLLIASQAIPIVVLAPILAIIIGYSISSKLVVVALVCFFPIAINTLDGLRGVDSDYVRMMRTLHGTKWLTFRRIELPSALPSFFSGMRVAAAFAPVGAVFGEFAGSNNGLGYVMLQAGPELQTARVLAAVLLLTVMAVLLVLAVTLCERLIAPWAREQRTNR